MLELQRALDAIAPATNDDIRCHESQHLEVFGDLASVPHLTVFGFEPPLGSQVRR